MLTGQLFLTLFSDHLHGRPTVLPHEYDEAALVRHAHQQQCEAIVYAQTRLPELQAAFAQTSYIAVNRRILLAKIHDAFAANKIPYLLFKGTEIAQYYPNPMLRSMGDSDILVHMEDRKRAGDVLAAMGFQADTSDDIEWHYKKNGMDFELHHRLLYDEAVNLPELKAWTDTAWEHASTEDGIRYVLEPEYHFVFLIVHLRKHLLNRGVGFRQFMDVAVMARQKLDWDVVNEYLGELGLTAFAANCFGMCKRWFDVEIPFAAEVSDDFYEAVTEKVFAGGVFGFDDKENKGNVINYELQSQSRFALFFKSAFLSYSKLRKLQAFAFLDGKPYLLPAAWVYRIFRILKEHRTKSAITNLLSPLTTPVIDGREEYLNEWGLQK